MNAPELNFKKWLESDSYANQREIIRSEINTPESPKRYAHISLQSPAREVRIDYSVFKQTPEQKVQAKEWKWYHRRSLQRAYGIGWKRFLNIPVNSLLEPIRMTF